MKYLAALLLSIAALIFAAGLLYQAYIVIHGVTLLLLASRHARGFTAEEIAAMCFTLSALLLMLTSIPRRWELTPPDTSPGEFIRQIVSAWRAKS